MGCPMVRALKEVFCFLVGVKFFDLDIKGNGYC